MFGLSVELALMQSYSRVKGMDFIKLKFENCGARYFLLQVLWSKLGNMLPICKGYNGIVCGI